MRAPVESIVIISLPEILRRYGVTSDEFDVLMQHLAPVEKRLTSGRPGYFVRDVEAAIAAIRDEPT
jgi:hypothetical protein